MQILIDKHIHNLFFTKRKYNCKVISRSNHAIYINLNNCRIITLFRCPEPLASLGYGASQKPHRYAQPVNPNPITAVFHAKFPEFFIENDEFVISDGKFEPVVDAYMRPLQLQFKLHKTKNIKSINWHGLNNRFLSNIKLYLKTRKNEGISSFFEGRSLKKIYILINQLKDSFKENKPDEFFDALCKIAGAGPGLTPSTDDFICGIISVLKLLNNGCLQNPSHPTLSPNGRWLNLKWKIPFMKICRQILKRTTKISWYYIVLAMMGYVADWQYDVLNIVGTGRDLSLQNINYGHTSGNDWLYGVYFALKGKL